MSFDSEAFSDHEAYPDPESYSDLEVSKDSEASFISKASSDSEIPSDPEAFSDHEAYSDPETDNDPETFSDPAVPSDLEASFDPEVPSDPEADKDSEAFFISSDPNASLDSETFSDAEASSDSESSSDSGSSSDSESSWNTESFFTSDEFSDSLPSSISAADSDLDNQHNQLCNGPRDIDGKIYTSEILISGFTKKTTLKELRIRFSVYGDIRDCYWFSKSRKDRQACIIFYETNSGMKAMQHGQAEEIFLHKKKLKVGSKFIDKATLQTHLENNGGNKSINELSDDCLLQICAYLPIMERLKLRRVCARLCTIANISLRILMHLDLGIYSDDLNTLDNVDQEKQLLELYRNLEQRQLQGEISPYYNRRYTPLNIIASINIHLVAVDCRNLTKLIIRCSTYNEHILTRVLMMNQKLRHIEIRRNPYITGESLIYLSEKIDTFIVEGCRNLQSNHLCAALKRLKNLKCLKLFEHNGYDILNIFNEYCLNLETLQLDFSVKSERMDLNKFLPITNLKNLKDLRISRYGLITETFLVNLSKNCQELRCLKIVGGGISFLIPPLRISERAMNAITSLAKLQILSMETNGINFGNLRELKKIHIEGSDIKEEQVVAVIRNSPKLRKLYLWRCENITSNILSEAKMISASRCNDVTLELTTGLCRVSHMEINEPRGTKRRVVFNGKIY